MVVHVVHRREQKGKKVPHTKRGMFWLPMTEFHNSRTIATHMLE